MKPNSCELLFRVDAEVRLPDRVDRWVLTSALEDLADDLMVDVTEPRSGLRQP